MASLKEVKRVVGLADRFGLEGREVLAKYTNTELGSVYNGIGPDRFPGWLRAVLDFLHPSLAPVACIHDVEWNESDGTKESCAASNRRFRRNGFRVARASFAWWRPRRHVVMWHPWKFARICQRFGWAAWMAPFDARQVAAAKARREAGA